MADVSAKIIKQLWNETPLSTWESLLEGLKDVYELDYITADQYEDLEWAINKVAGNAEPFPDSPGELHTLLDNYM